MNPDSAAIGEWLGQEAWLALDDFARACGVDRGFIVTLVDEELVRPALAAPEWRFGGAELARVRRVRRLQRDFDANLQSVAVMLDLLDEIDRLRGVLDRAGLAD
jgi:chaperone modulatory protein CbpM